VRTNSHVKDCKKSTVGHLMDNQHHSCKDMHDMHSVCACKRVACEVGPNETNETWLFGTVCFCGAIVLHVQTKQVWSCYVSVLSSQI